MLFADAIVNLVGASVGKGRWTEARKQELLASRLTSLVVQPERPVAGTDARIVCRVRNFAPAEAKTTVQLSFGEVRQSRPLTLPAWGEGVAEFRVPCGE